MTPPLAWRYQWPEQCYSGRFPRDRRRPAFVGRNADRPRADSASGKQLWETQTGAGMHAPVSTFERNGKQASARVPGGSAPSARARRKCVALGPDGRLGRIAGAPMSRQVAVAPVRRMWWWKQPPFAGPRGRHEADGKSGYGAVASLSRFRSRRHDSDGHCRSQYTPSFSANFTPEQIRDVSGCRPSALARQPGSVRPNVAPSPEHHDHRLRVPEHHTIGDTEVEVWGDRQERRDDHLVAAGPGRA